MLVRRDARIDGNPLWGRDSGFGVLHNDGARCRLIARNLPCLPPTERGPIADALLFGILGEFHTKKIAYLMLSVKR